MEREVIDFIYAIMLLVLDAKNKYDPTRSQNGESGELVAVTMNDRIYQLSSPDESRTRTVAIIPRPEFVYS